MWTALWVLIWTGGTNVITGVFTGELGKRSVQEPDTERDITRLMCKRAYSRAWIKMEGVGSALWHDFITSFKVTHGRIVKIFFCINLHRVKKKYSSSLSYKQCCLSLDWFWTCEVICKFIWIILCQCSRNCNFFPVIDLSTLYP